MAARPFVWEAVQPWGTDVGGLGEGPHEGLGEGPHEGLGEGPYEGLGEGPHEGLGEGPRGDRPSIVAHGPGWCLGSSSTRAHDPAWV